jgi:hypothetical protein
VKRLEKLLAIVFAIAGVVMLWQGGGFIWLGLISLIIGLPVLVGPDGDGQTEPSVLAEYENLRHAHPSREATRSDYVLHGPSGGWGPGDGGAI